MNAIEQRFYDAFLSFIKGLPGASIHSASWEMKIAEYRILEGHVFEEEEYCGSNIDITFPSLPEEIKNPCLGICLMPQVKVGSYTIDFVLDIEGFVGDIIKLAIEIDGHDFHEKTKEQSSYDKRRDREISTYDYTVIRFTGSEVYTNALKCVQEVIDILITLTFERYQKYSSWFIEECIQFDKAIRGIK